MNQTTNTQTAPRTTTAGTRNTGDQIFSTIAAVIAFAAAIAASLTFFNPNF